MPHYFFASANSANAVLALHVFILLIPLCSLPSGPLLQGKLQVPAPSSPPKDPAGDQWQEQPNSAEKHGHAGPADAARQRHDTWHAAAAGGESMLERL